MTGPLHGLRILELAGVGPGPFAAMMLADHGANVVRIERDGQLAIPGDPLMRGRTLLKLDLKRPEAKRALLDLAAHSDGLIDPYRPGRIEALGVGPQELHAANPKLVIGRITGWGQHGPLSQQAGHDINYLALSGLLSRIGSRSGRPLPPMNLLADYGAGAMMLCFGMLSSLLEVKAGAPQGRVIDAAMSEASALLGSLIFHADNLGWVTPDREDNHLDGGMALYGTYRCSDGEYLAVGAIETVFQRQFLKSLGLHDDPVFADPMDRDRWPDQREILAERIGAEPLSYWLRAFEGKDACVSPVLGLSDAARHPHHVAGSAFFDSEKGRIPAPAPRYGEAAERPASRQHEAEALLVTVDRL